MFAYYFQLGLSSLRRNRLLTLLMMVTIGFGVAASMTTYAVFRATSGDPIPNKSSSLFIAQLDNYGPESSQDNEPLPWLSWRDTRALMQAHKARRQAAIYAISTAVITDEPGQLAYPVLGYATFSDFFGMLQVPFIYGAPWSAVDDENGARVVVIGKALNQRVFKGRNSVGHWINLDGMDYRVVGVTGSFDARPRFFDLDNHDGFGDLGELYMPFPLAIAQQKQPAYSTACNRPYAPGWDNFIKSECVWISLWVELPDAASVRVFHQFLYDYAAEQQRKGRFNWPPNIRLRNVLQWLDYRHVVPREARMSLWIAAAFLVICLVNTLGLLLAKFMRRASEIGIRRALGASRRTIYAQFLIEALIVGIAGGLLGLALTAVGVMGIGLVFDPAIAALAHVDLPLVGWTLALAAASTLLAAFYPTWRASRVQPAWHLKAN